MLTVYGISNCDTVRRARKRLEQSGVAYRFHDFRKDGLDVVTVQRWLAQDASAVLLNRRGTTWRKLSDDDKARATDDLARLFVEQPSLIKRPVFEKGGEIRVGFPASDESTVLDWIDA